MIFLYFFVTNLIFCKLKICLVLNFRQFLLIIKRIEFILNLYYFEQKSVGLREEGISSTQEPKPDAN